MPLPPPAREIEVEVVPKGAAPRRVGGKIDDPIMALVARLMDTLFRIPGTKVRFGLDPVIGLIPMVGSPISAFVSLLMLIRSAQHRVPNVVLARMALNILINALLDAIPGIGDAVSIFYRSNAKNHELLLKHAGTRRPATPGDKLFVFGLIAAVVLIIVLVIVGAVTIAAKTWAAVLGH